MKSVNAPKVLILTQSLGMGGLEKTLVKLAAGLAKRASFVPEIYAYDQDPDTSPWRDEIRASGFKLTALLKDPGFSWKVVKALKEKIRDEDIRIVHTHDLNALLYGALVKWSGAKIALVHTQHTFLHLNKLKHRIYERIFPRATDLIVCPSSSLAKIYEQHGFRNTKIVRNGIENLERRFSRDAREAWLAQGVAGGEALAAWKRLQESVKKRWVLVLGRVHSGKGQENFLQLWSQLNPDFRKDTRVLMVGPANEAAYLEKLKSLSKTLPDAENILWVGATGRPLQWMVMSDVFVSLSDFEGMPLAPTEAYLSGLPLVLSDIPGHLDLKLPGTAFISRDDATALEAEILKARAPSENELSRVRRNFSMDTMIEGYEDAYRASLEKVKR